jgi:hypothetical protein
MQISTTKNPNFEKPFINPSKNRLGIHLIQKDPSEHSEKKFFGYLPKKFGSAYA